MKPRATTIGPVSVPTAKNKFKTILQNACVYILENTNDLTTPFAMHVTYELNNTPIDLSESRTLKSIY